MCVCVCVCQTNIEQKGNKKTVQLAQSMCPNLRNNNHLLNKVPHLNNLLRASKCLETALNLIPLTKRDEAQVRS